MDSEIIKASILVTFSYSIPPDEVNILHSQLRKSMGISDQNIVTYFHSFCDHIARPEVGPNFEWHQFQKVLLVFKEYVILREGIKANLSTSAGDAHTEERSSYMRGSYDDSRVSKATTAVYKFKFLSSLSI